MKEIRSETKNIYSLLANSKFGIDFYQREYRWEESHVSQLIEDLSETFLKSYKPHHVRANVESYEVYFVGTIIVSDVENDKFIVDGQQRLTSLTLLLIALQHQQSIPPTQKATMQNLIFSETFGVKSYNIDVSDRTACMDSLFKGTIFDVTKVNGSAANMLDRYEDINDALPDDILKEEILPMFIDWLLYRVFAVEIIAFTHTDAYTMFESMNDRGLSLTQWEMLRGYLLSKVDSIHDRQRSNETWKRRADELNNIDRNALGNGIQAWLRSQHATNMVAYDAIGNAYNRWVRDQEQILELEHPADYARFINRDFDFYTKWYSVIRTAAQDSHFAEETGLKSVRYNQWTNFTLQYPALLSTLEPNDEEPDVWRKLRIVSAYIDSIVTRRMWSFWAVYESYMRSRIFNGLITQIRGQRVDELAAFLASRLEEYDAQFVRNDFGMHQMNRRQIRYILARITDHIEVGSGQRSSFEEFMARGGKNPFEIEHIWANDFDRDGEEFGHFHDFEQYRSRIGGLLLLPKSFNASFGAEAYGVKYEHYYGQNYLAKTLHERTYERDPGFLGFKERTGLKFRSHTEFDKADLDERQELYRRIAMQVWSADSIRQAAS